MELYIRIMKTISIIIQDISRGNGTERAVTNLANSLCAYGDYKVHIISCNSTQLDSPYFELDDTVAVHHLGIAFTGKLDYLHVRRPVERICAETKTDFLLGTSHSLNIAMLGVRVRGLKKVACEHMNYAAPSFLSRLARRLAYPRLDAVVLLTNADAGHYGFISPKKKFVIPNSVPQSEESAACENKIMLAVGRYTRQKGFDMLIRAFAMVHRRIPGWTLRIVGQGEGLLRSLIQENSLEDKVELVPPTKDIQAEYLRAGMFVLSSRWEGFVLVLTEAKDAGLPSVAFNCPEGPADILRDGRDGFLVEPGNMEEFGERIVRLANDEGLRKEFGRAAKEDIKRLSPESVFALWDRLFGELARS